MVYAHRGASADAPENTVAAFAEAVRQGADGVELDVRRTADGMLVVHHDASLPDGRLVMDVAYADLPLHVATLTEALDACGELVVNVEIKNLPADPDHDASLGIADAVAAVLLGRPDPSRFLVSSFHLATIDRVRAVAPGLSTALLTSVDPPPLSGVVVAAARGHVAIHPYDLTVDEELVAAAHEAGLAVNVWTVDDPTRIRALAALGVDGIVTNRPGATRAALGR